MTTIETKPRQSRLADAALPAEEILPLQTTQPSFFYGWLVLLIAAFGMFASAPGQSFSVATFKEPMRESLGVSDTWFSAAYLVATLVSGACLPFVGRMTDRFGARMLLPIIAAGLGGACIWMSSVQGLIGLFIGFCLIRPLGQGSLTLVSTWLAGHWFDKRRGLAMGLLGLGGTLSVMIVPQINHYMTTHYGWRIGWVCLAVIVWAILILPAILFVRNQPEEIGLLPDGRREEDEPQTADPTTIQPPLPQQTNFTVVEACRDVTFWKLLAPVCTGALVGTGLVFHQVSIMGERNISPGAAITILSIQAAMASVGAIFFGYLSDRLPERRLMAMLFIGGAQLLQTSLSSVGLAVVYGMMIGTHGAILRTAGTAVWVNYYGRLHQGEIRGIVLKFQIVASALGPLPFALSKDFLGSYLVGNLALLVLPIGSAIAVWTARAPHESPTGKVTEAIES